MPFALHAQPWTVEPSVGAELTWSSNAELGSAGGRDDTILDVRSRVAVRNEGRRLRLGGFVGLDAITSARGTQPSRILPQADANARLEAIERFLFVDAGVRAQQTAVDPFGVRPEASTSRNTLTAASAFIAPTIERDFGPSTRLRARSENSWTRETGAGDTASASAAEGSFARHSLLVERDPRPLGWRLEAERSRTRYRNNVPPTATTDVLRASTDYAFTDWTLGVRAGRERTTLLPDDTDHTIWGLQARWRPSPRTTLDGFAEKRFFGNAGRLGFAHRRARFALTALVARSLDTTPQSLFELPAFENVVPLLDAALTSRFPDPVERARVVEDLIAREGLPATTLSPLSVFAPRISIVSTRQVSLAVLGVRNTLTLTAYQTRTEDLPQTDPLLVSQALGNNKQRGASVLVGHRLTPTVALTGSADWARIRALRTEERSIERTLRARANVQLGPRTTTFAGARYRHLSSNVVVAGRERAVFVGLDHRF